MPARRTSGPLLSRHNRSGSLARRPRTHHSDLRDSAPVDRGDLEPVALDLDGIPDGPEPPQATEHEAANGVVRLVRQLDAEPVPERLERGEPIDDERSGRFFFEGGRLAIELVVDLADQLLDDVLERHQTGRPAELIEDDRKLHALPPEFRKRLLQ